MNDIRFLEKRVEELERQIPATLDEKRRSQMRNLVAELKREIQQQRQPRT